MIVTICSYLTGTKCWKLKTWSVSIMSFHQNLDPLDPLLCQTQCTKSSGRENRDTHPAQGTGVPGSTVVLHHWHHLVGKPSHPPPLSDGTNQLPFSLHCLSVHVLQHRMLLVSSPRHTVRTKEQPGINSSIIFNKDAKPNTGAVLLLWPDGSEEVNFHQVFVKKIPAFHTEDTTSSNNSLGWCCLFSRIAHRHSGHKAAPLWPNQHPPRDKSISSYH